MAAKPLEVYLADTSGSQVKPISGSRVDDPARIIHRTHVNLLKGLSGQGLTSKSERFEDYLNQSLHSANMKMIGRVTPTFWNFFRTMSALQFWSQSLESTCSPKIHLSYTIYGSTIKIMLWILQGGRHPGSDQMRTKSGVSCFHPSEDGTVMR